MGKNELMKQMLKTIANNIKTPIVTTLQIFRKGEQSLRISVREGW